MQIKSLRLFLAVVESGSFVAAAERMHTVQSNVTAHIKRLEQELDARLLDRQARVRLTPAGRSLVAHAERIVGAHDEAIAAFQGQCSPSGALHLGAMETTMALRLPAPLAAFHAQYPDVDLRVRTGPTADLVEAMAAGRLDCAFVAGRVEDPRLYQAVAFNERLALVAGHPLSTLPSSEQLQGSTFLAFRQGCSYRQRVELLLASHGISSARIFDFGTLDAILGCVAAGMGYALLPQAVVEAHADRFGIHACLLPEEIGAVDTWFVARSQECWTPTLQRFAESVLPPRHDDPEQ